MMDTTQNKEKIIQETKTYLRSFHMLAYDSWISGCVTHFIEKGYTLQQIKESAYEQWLLHELKIVCPGSLPNNISKLEKTVLHGQYILEMISALDISESLYQQYLKLKKTDTENIIATMNPEEKISCKRLLKIKLTDGKQTIEGMEYETIRKLKTEDIVEGRKIMIIGPVQCRNGILLLTDSVVEFLKFEVLTMPRANTLAALLASKLNLPSIEHESNENALKINTVNRVTHNESSPAIQDRRPRQDSVTNRQSVTHSNPGTSRNNKPTETSRNTEYASNKRSLETETVPDKKMKFEELPDIGDDMDEFDEDVLRAMDECERQHSISNTHVTCSSDPFVYIKQIKELSESIKSGNVYRVKAQIQNVQTKLTMIANREWNLKCTIIDGTGSMDVEFSSDILSSFLGYTPEKIRELKKNVANNPMIKNDINSAFKKTAETLRNLYCIMELTMNTLPKITKLIDFNESHSELLKKRLKSKSHQNLVQN